MCLPSDRLLDNTYIPQQDWLVPNPGPWVSPIVVPSEVRTTTNTIITSEEGDNTAEDISQVLDELEELLLEKNRKYGDSALNPSRIFSRSDAVEQIKVRIDDKLTRLKNAQDDEDEDVVQDLMGYLVLLRIAQKRAKGQISRGITQASGFITVTSPEGVYTTNSDG